MENCGCYDPGFILGLLLGAPNGRAVNVWLQEAIKQLPGQVEDRPLSEKDVVWMGDVGGADALNGLVTIKLESQPEMERVADLSLDIKGPQGFKTMLEQFLTLLSQDVRIIKLVFPVPGSDTLQAKIHLTIRLLRSILLSVHSTAQLLPYNPDTGLEKASLWGNTLNEAHLVYNDELPKVLLQCLADADATILSQWAAMLRLPGTNVAYYNHLSLDLITQKQQIYSALAACLALSGLPGLDGRLELIDVIAVRRLLEARQKSTVFQPASAQMVIDLDNRVFTLLKISPDALQMALCLVNFTSQVVNVIPDAQALGLPEAGWVDLISGKPLTLGGKGIALEGYGAIWLCQAV